MLLALCGSVRSRTVLALALFWGVAELLPRASAHNWLQKPESRSSGVSNKPSCDRKRGSQPHVQLNPGDSFPMEWRIAHKSHKQFTYFAIIRAEDEDKLAMASKGVMDDYLKRAPSTAAMATMKVTCGDHRAQSCAECKTGRCEGECTFTNGVCELDATHAYRNTNNAYPEGRYMDTEMYDRRFVSAESNPRKCLKNNRGVKEAIQHGVEIPQGDPRNIRRPAPFNCQGTAHKLQTMVHLSGRSKKRKDSLWQNRNHRKNCLECGLFKQYEYYNNLMKDDQRAGYNSSKYPWIVSVSRYNTWATVSHHSRFARLDRSLPIDRASHSPFLFATLSISPSLFPVCFLVPAPGDGHLIRYRAGEDPRFSGTG